MDINKKTSFSNNSKRTISPLKSKGVGIRRGALDNSEKVSSLAPEIHKKDVHSLQIGLFTHSHILSNSVESATLGALDVNGLSSSKQMFEWCKKNKPKYILIDIDSPTPIADGLKLFKAVSTLNLNIRQIVFTQTPSQSTSKQMLSGGAHALLKKPFRAEALLELIL